MEYNLDFKTLKTENGEFAIVAVISTKDGVYNMPVPNYRFEDEESANNFINNNRMSLLSQLGIVANGSNERSTPGQKSNDSSYKPVKITVPEPDKNVEYHVLKNQEGKYYVRVTFFGSEGEIPDKSFDTLPDAEKFVIENYKNIEKLLYEKYGNGKINDGSTKVKGKGQEDVLEVTIPGQDENIKYYVVRDDIEYLNCFYICVEVLDANQKINIFKNFFNQEKAVKYIEENYDELAKKAYKKANKGVRGKNDDGEKTGKIVGTVCLIGAAGILTAALVSSCHSCAKGSGKATDPKNGVTVNITNTPNSSLNPSQTPSGTSTEDVVLIPSQAPTEAPTEEPNVLSMSDIDLLAGNVFDEYVSKNVNVKITDNGAMNGSVITSNDLIDVITILNINKLSTENYDLFSKLVSDKQPGAYFKGVDDLVANLMSLNMQKYYGEKTTEGMIWFSSMMLNDNDRKDMNSFEGLIEGIMNASLEGNKSKTQELTDNLIKILDDPTMLNRGDGFDRGLYYELSVFLNCVGKNITKKQYDRIVKIMSSKREATNVRIEKILSNVMSIGCYAIIDLVDKGRVIDSELVRIRRC